MELTDLELDLARQLDLVGDLLIDAYLVGYNSGLYDASSNKEGQSIDLSMQEDLEDLVRGQGLDCKEVLRRLYCNQQISGGDCE
jgi:hypothetical protein